jgi:hypothetical protein
MTRWIMLIMCCLLAGIVLAEELPAPLPGGCWSLAAFGPIATPAQAEGTLAKAAAALIAKGGGVIIIPAEAPANWSPENVTQGTWRTPAAPAPAKGWGNGPGVTLIDYRDGTMKVLVPQATGTVFSRTMRMPEGQSCGHWGYFPMLSLENNVVRGTTSYRDWLVNDVKAGKEQRFYVPTIRGIFPGMFLNTGDYSGVQRLYVRSIGFDAEKGMHYFTADTDADIKAKSLLHNKNHANALLMTTNANTENQTFDVFIDRHHYSQGDTYLFAAHFNYMGDVHSTAGDENGVIFAAFSNSETNIFRGTVEAFDAKTNALKYKGGVNAHTLATGRPLINLNAKKWITGGSVLIVRPGTWWDLDDKHVVNPVFEGKGYPTVLGKADGSGAPELRMGGLLRFTKDAPLTPAVVGRYFAVDEKDELVPGANLRRWYMIGGFKANADGTKEIILIRHWWGAKPAGAPTLYNPDNYTQDGHLQPLHYVIAPGANVYDVADGMKPGGQNTNGALNRTVKVAPGPDTGTASDFAAGDAVEQAIGPDPFKPIPFRAYCFDSVPGAFPAPIFDIANHGPVSRSAVMTVAGNNDKADKKPPFENILVVDTAVNNGIVFGGDTGNAALLFRQPNGKPQPIKWRYDGGSKEASLMVSPKDGTMRFDGNGLLLPGGVVNVGGLSATATMAKNLRGVNVPVTAGAKELVVKFPTPEADANYAVFLEQSWLTNRAVSAQTAEGFTVQFETPPAADGRLHWMLIR